ncbi:MAG: PSD1 and planctomycete cytochrome C domain-containing protein [Rubripirellula sp.]
MRLTFPIFAILVLSCANADQPDFGRDIRPILAKHCFTCHGPDPDAREADLRLDQEVAAKQDLGGYAAIAPGNPEESEMIVRVASQDPDQRMPPADSHPPLSKSEIDLLRRWIASGGDYQTHWAFVPPTKPTVPDLESAWCAGPIDRFVWKRMQDASLSPSEPAARPALIRRVYLDLTGTTPTPTEVDRFLADDSPVAYERLVDRLLASADYAERFARPWLDLARYSDTNGYEKDRPRSIWPYRDWVIGALASDQPFDQFSVEQLAGDMLQNPTNDQLIATGFHRNTMLNEEGGIDPLEYRYYAMVDRVATTGTVWMGLTTGCAQCHTHKYDPITHTDYYSLFALLNSADEPDVVVESLENEQKQRSIEQQITQIEDKLIEQHLPSQQLAIAAKASGDKTADAEESISSAFLKWLDQQVSTSQAWQRIRPSSLESTMPKLTVLDDDSILGSGDVTKREVYRLKFPLDHAHDQSTAIRLEVLPHDSLPAGGPGMAFYEGRLGDFFLSDLIAKVDGQKVELNTPSLSYGKISVGSGKADAKNVLDGEGSTGWSTSGHEGQANQWVANFAEPIQSGKELEIELIFERHFAAALGRFRFSLTAAQQDAAPAVASKLPPSLLDWHANRLDQIKPEDYRELQRQFVRSSDQLKKHRQPIEALQKQLPEVVRTLGMKERVAGDGRTTHRHHRGEYLQPKEVVTPAVPSLFPPMDKNLPANRLALAKWLVGKENPLAARVTVNRMWREFFGTGIVRTAGDFGTQSEPPTHPELLDWLACEFRDSGWSQKRMHRQIVLSSTYRQAAGSAPESDPQNRLLSMFPARRLGAESIRDALLSAAGLLTRKVGGPSVYPPQPESVMQMAYSSPKWDTSKGEDRYRRSVYTFSKRTAPFAAFTTFDGPTGELCVARRDRSTTPLQALTLLNDAMYYEIAIGLADQTLRDVGQVREPTVIARHMFRRLLSRSPEQSELDAIVAFFESQQTHERPWALVARALINTDEAITTP